MDAAATQPFARRDWWDKAGAFRLLHDINPLRLQWLQAQAGGALRGKRLLDVGCGGGIFAEAAAAAGAVVDGIDAEDAAIAAAQRHAQEGGISIAYHVGSSVAALPPAQYDIIACFEVLEHAADPAGMVADIAQRLAPGGVAAFSTINRSARAWALMIAGLEYLAKIIPPNTHDYRKFIQPAELARLCRHSGLAVRDVRGLQYSFFGRFYRLCADTGVNYFLAAQRDAAP